jgi:hypothetical protein
MAKKNSVPNGQLGDWGDKVPKGVQDAADAYDKAHTAKTKAQGSLNTAKETLVEKMRAAGVKKVRIRNGEKFLKISSTDKITYEKPQEDPAA